MYAYILDEEGNSPPFTFIFETNIGLKYYVIFDKYGDNIFEYPFKELYTVDFSEESNSIGKHDERISSTIVQIIIDFINRDSNIILFYVCDSSDLKQKCRSRLFTKWKLLIDSPHYVKSDVNLSYSDIEMSLIYVSASYPPEDIEENVVLYLDSLEREKS